MREHESINENYKLKSNNNLISFKKKLINERNGSTFTESFSAIINNK